MNKLLKAGYVAGVMSVAFYLICMGWGFVLESSELSALHLQLLQMTYPGFDFAFTGLLIGFGEAFIYGFFFGAIFWGVCRMVYKDDCCSCCPEKKAE